MNEIKWIIIIGYLIIVNIVAFAMMGIDKKKAIRHKWRIPEKSLFLAAIVGGSIGGILGMRMFRHKTKHLSFVIGFPSILFIQIMVLIWMILE